MSALRPVRGTHDIVGDDALRLRWDCVLFQVA
jgi:hypothetical protein